MFARGDTFYGPVNIRNRTPHLWIVLHCGPAQILWVNVTTYRKGRDESCILIPGDHPFVTQTSIINYREAHDPPIEYVLDALNRASLIRREPCSKEMIEKILIGAQTTRFLKSKFKQLCT